MNKKTLYWIVGIVTFIGLTTWLFFFIQEEMRIDGCLDKGGRWDYKTNSCDTLSLNDSLDSLSGMLGGEVIYDTLNKETNSYINDGDTLITNLFEFEYIGKVTSNCLVLK